jgi:DNA-binding LacI/PurR family transcriptional regulator
MGEYSANYLIERLNTNKPMPERLKVFKAGIIERETTRAQE